MSREVIFTDNFAKPIFQQRATYIIVICCPLFFAGIISWVNINTVNFPCIHRQKGFQGKQVIAFNDEIAVCLIGLEMQFWYFFQRMIRNGQVVIPEDIFPFKLQRGHEFPFLLLNPPHPFAGSIVFD